MIYKPIPHLIRFAVQPPNSKISQLLLQGLFSLPVADRVQNNKLAAISVQRKQFCCGLIARIVAGFAQ
jgi:hypothetical protein